MELSSDTTWTYGTAVDVASNHRLNFGTNNYISMAARAWNDSTLASYVDNVSMTGVVPEPATMGLLAIGGLGIVLRRRSR
jgi:hypothetical protein